MIRHASHRVSASRATRIEDPRLFSQLVRFPTLANLSSDTFTIDGDSEVARSCAAGMNVDGDPAAAHALFIQAWELRRDDYEASIAAHFVARHQPSPEQSLHWNQLAVNHAKTVEDDRAQSLFASLYLNLGESLRVLGRYSEALAAATRGLSFLEYLPAGGYRDFVESGLRRLEKRATHVDAK